MCGITAYLSNKLKCDCFDYLFFGLKQLQNRGYDSSGIASYDNKENTFNIDKYASDDVDALTKLEKHKENHKSNIGIGHTRWATHGPKTDTNAHPHLDMTGNFVLVHNGIIENFKSLKNNLINKGYKFKSETDTEVIVNLLSYNYKISQNVEKAINITTKMMEGTWGLVVMSLYEKNTLYVTRKGSPILLSINDNFCLVSSEKSGFGNKVTNYFCLDNDDICKIYLDNDKLKYSTNKSYSLIQNEINDFKESPEPYPHWTLKEINDQIESIYNALGNGGRIRNQDKNSVRLNGLSELPNKNIDNVIFLGCGTSLHAGMIGVKLFKELCNFNTVQCFDGAEFNEYDLPKKGNTTLILLSQSGETRDLQKSLELAKKLDLQTIGVVNVVGSLIAREVDCGCYAYAGREVAVASTKAFTNQIVVLTLMAMWFANYQKVSGNKVNRLLKEIRQLSNNFKDIIQNSQNKMEKWADKIKEKNSIFLLGKNKSEIIASEGALKIKEISYIHAEGYAGGSLKHGPFGLLEKDYPVILISPDSSLEDHAKMINACEEIKSRHATVYFITDCKEKINLPDENILLVPKNSFSYLLSIVPLQLLAYYLSIKKNINPDFPRNLAKVVTVE